MKSNCTLHTRRRFLRTSALGAAAAWTLPVFLEKTFFTLDALAADALTQTVTGKDGTILVVLQMAGGNDGLNTVVPFADDAYFRARPRLGLAADTILKLDHYAGLNSKLAGLKTLFDEGHLTVVQGVGYPNPNRSHFRSTEIWQTASDADRTTNEGWLGRYFDNCCAGADPTVGVAIGEEMPQAFAARTPTGVTFSRPEQFRWTSSEPSQGRMSAEEFFFRQLNESGGGDDNPGAAADGASVNAIAGKTKSDVGTLDFLQRTALDAQLSSDKILAIARKYKSSCSLSPGPTGRQPEHHRAHDRRRPAHAGLLRQPGRVRHTCRTSEHTRALDGRVQRRRRGFCERPETTGKFRSRPAHDFQRVWPPRFRKCKRRHRSWDRRAHVYGWRCR